MSEAGQQSNQKPNSDPVIRRAVSVRRPAVLAFVAFAMGLCLDRHFDLSLQFWLASTAFLLVVTFGTRLPWARLNRISIFSSLLSVAVAAGLWHHLHWSILPANDIAAYCQEDGLPVRIRGVLAESVEIREAKYGPRIPAWMELDRSTCEFRCDEIEQGSEWVQVSGTLWLTVDGHLVHVGVGDQVEIFGRLTKPSPPRNPGEVDFQDILRSRGWSGFLRVEHPQAVRFLAMQRGAWWSFLRCREGIREAAHRQLAKHLNSENRAVALSVLIGDRTLMTDELRDRFVKSGTMHLLAISGLHVAILVGMVAVLCRGLGLAPKTSALILISVVILYALLTNHRPPVYRATMLAAIALIGSVRGRALDGINLLSATGLILLVWHPSDLFDLGAQLSFLAVGAILWATKAWPPSNVYVEPDPLTPERSPFVDLLLSGLRVIGRMLLVTTCIWTVTAPLTISTFHVAAPVGMLLNVLLIPFTTVVLGLGYLLLFMGVIFPPFASVVGPVFDGALSLFLAVVRWGELSPGGHLFLAEIPTWWQMGYYACLLGLWLMWGLRPQVRWGFHLLLTWMAIGLVSAFFVSRDELFRCSFLSVGHGLATIIELPSGQTLLYDAGTIGDGTLAERIVERALWSRGISRIDGIVISHADHDHYSGVFGLLEKFPVGTLFLTQSSVDASQEGITELCLLADAKGTNIQLVQQGDELVTDSHPDYEIELRVIHPPGGFQAKADNSHSVVLEIVCQGKRVLLTGDLEKEGFPEFFKLESRHCDVLLAPHHGGRAANVPQLYEWATPDTVIVSTNDVSRSEPLRETIGDAELLTTRESGAITVTIEANGQLHLEEFLSRNPRNE